MSVLQVQPKLPEQEILLEGTSLWQDAIKRLKKNKMAVVGCVVILFLVIACLLGPPLIKIVWGYDYDTQDLNYGAQSPSLTHLFGTDFHGRDLLTRVLHGGRIS